MKKLFPGTYEAEQERKSHSATVDDEPDYIAGAPNYDKFKNWTPEEVLCWMNID